MRKSTQTGLSLVEVIVGVAIIAVLLVVISQIIGTYLSSVRSTQDTVIAVYQAESVLETARIIRDADWSTFVALPLDTTLYPEYAAGTTSLASTNPDPAAAYQTEVHVRSVYRDSMSDELRTSTDTGTYVDTRGRLVEVTVFKDGVELAEQTTLLTNLFEL